MKLLMIVQMHEMKIRGPLISAKISRTVSMVKSNKNLLRLCLDDSQNGKNVKTRVISCIYTIVIVAKMEINRHTWEVMAMARARTEICRPQHDSWVPTTFNNIIEGFVSKPLFTEVLPSRGGMMSTL